MHYCVCHILINENAAATDDAIHDTVQKHRRCCCLSQRPPGGILCGVFQQVGGASSTGFCRYVPKEFLNC